MKKYQMFAVIMLCFSIALTGCGSNKNATPSDHGSNQGTTVENGAAGASVQHEWGTWQEDQVPQKVVTLDFSFIDTLTSLGVVPAGNAGVGTTKIPEYLQGLIKSEVTDIGERKAPNLEVIQSLKPDLIIASVDRHSMIRAELEGIASTVAFDDVSYTQVLDNVKSIGELLGKQAEAEKVISDLTAKIDDVKGKVEGQPSIIVAGFFDDEFTVWIKDSFIGSLLSSTGVDYAYNGEISKLEGKGEGSKLTLERVHEINPDYIMVYGDSTEKLKSNPLYQDLKSVKDGHFIEVDRNLWARGRGPIAASNILDELLLHLKAE
ncbi:ABC transporter substrate-binding protein [Paenibacillus paeoniae]|uniref:Iron-siderophore ABC transporter substrate-binding protein n=1 Tax=Paenibacillus paeoniae TaxID=2292705 RepID=A0A371PIW7_9BACL|nr:iron-siderophore ABC transporter substrate-binding protein [Paenibacillus paeoniae]REK76162.1 iron-siderophore ABC transporter substrate-binding protein [Paenibacillus paeoniae]